MAVEEELKRDHTEMQAMIEAKQKIIDAQVWTFIVKPELAPPPPSHVAPPLPHTCCCESQLIQTDFV